MNFTRLSILTIALSALTLGVAGAHGQVLSSEPPEAIRGLEVSDKLGFRIPLDVEVFDSNGATVEIGSYMNDRRPTVLLLVYYDCPMLCGLMLDKMNEVINGVEQTVGEDYRILVVSFDHTNTTEMARQMQERWQRAYDRGLDELGQESYLFHIATAGEARRLADSVGFDYRFQPQSGEFAHPSVMYILTPDGTLSSYLSGLDYEPKQLRLALIDAADSKIARSIGDFFLHLCFSFDPEAGAFTLQAFRVMQIAGVLSIIGVAGLIGGLRVLELVRRRTAVGRPTAGGDSQVSSSSHDSMSGPLPGAVQS